MTTTVLRCERCGRRCGTVSDTRFGLLPAGTVCPACSRHRVVPLADLVLLG